MALENELDILDAAGVTEVMDKIFGNDVLNDLWYVEALAKCPRLSKLLIEGRDSERRKALQEARVKRDRESAYEDQNQSSGGRCSMCDSIPCRCSVY